MRIGIIGAGAIGGWLAIRLSKAGHRVSVLARGKILEAISKRPWRLDDGHAVLEARVIASADAKELGIQDLLIVAVKGPALVDLLPQIQQMSDAKTIVLPAMNGVPWWFMLDSPDPNLREPLASVDPEGAISRVVPAERIMGAVVYTSAAVAEPGTVRLLTGNKLIIGEPGGYRSPRSEQIAGLFSDAGIETVESDRIKYEIWYKLWGNMTINPISAMTGATSDRILDDPMVSEFILQVMSEAQAIGNKIGLRIAERGEDRNAVTRSWGAFKTSMLQDAEAGRMIELDQLVAAPREMAHRLGVPTPSLDALLGLTRVFARQHRLYPRAPSQVQHVPYGLAGGSK